MVRPKLLQPKDVAVGDLVQARDGTHWYNAKVIAKTGRGASIAAVVRFIGFSESHNAKFTAAMQGMRKRLSRAYLQQERMEALWGEKPAGLNADGTFEVERILSREGKKSFVVRWAGWGSEYDSVVAKADIDSAMVNKFEEEERVAAEPPAKTPAVPFTELLTAEETNEQHEWRIADCGARRRTRTRLSSLRAPAPRRCPPYATS